MMLTDDTYYGHLEGPVRVVGSVVLEQHSYSTTVLFFQKISCFKNEAHEIP